MDMSSIAASLRISQSGVGTYVMHKAMGQDAQSIATLLQDMGETVPTPSSIDGRLDARA